MHNQIQQHQQQIQSLETQLQELREEKISSNLQCEQIEKMLQVHQRGSEMLNTVRDGLARDTSKLKDERQALKLLQDLFNQTRSAVDTLNMRAQNISQQSQETADATQKLEVTAQSIGRLVGSIQEISDQTNLLALNAAIEAARAGEHGRGFAVVADEVRQLAANASSASGQIEQLITDIARQITSIKNLVEISQAGAEEVSTSAVQINSTVDQVISSSDRMQQVIHETTTNAFLNTVKLDHAVWKAGIYQRISEGRFNEDAGDHTQCRLGQWYFTGYGRRNFSHLSSFKNLNRPHEAVHKYGNQALAAGARDDIETLVAALEAMEDAGHQVVTYIDNLQQELASS